MKKLSILIPAYNVESYIEECVNSVLDLDTNYEIIIINDGSTDNTLKILNKYKKYEYIKIINQKNMGISRTRNNLLKKLKVNIFFFSILMILLTKKNLKNYLKKLIIKI